MIEFETETEKLLYEERKQMMAERDEARKELQELKQKSKDTFSVYRYYLSEKNSSAYNATMVIKKDGYRLSLDPEEIKEVFKCASQFLKDRAR